MGDLTRNLSRREFACRCGCGMIVCDYELVTVLQEAVDYFCVKLSEPRLKIHITSGNRCAKHNALTPGAESTSKHVQGIAADNWITHVSPQELYTYYNYWYPDRYGLGLYHNRVHLDVRSERARWNKI